MTVPATPVDENGFCRLATPEGHFGEHHAVMARLHLDNIDYLDAAIDRVDEPRTRTYPSSSNDFSGALASGAPTRPSSPSPTR